MKMKRYYPAIEEQEKSEALGALKSIQYMT